MCGGTGDYGGLEPDRTPNADGCGWIFAFAVMPFALLAGGTFVVGGLFIRLSSVFRPVLEVAFPASWISRTSNGDGEPLRVFIVVMLFTLTLTLMNVTLRRTIYRASGVRSSADLRTAHIVAFTLNFLLVFTIVAGLGFGSFAAGVAVGADLEVDTSLDTPFQGPSPWFMTFVGVAFWAALVTYLSRHRRRRFLTR